MAADEYFETSGGWLFPDLLQPYEVGCFGSERTDDNSVRFGSIDKRKFEGQAGIKS